MVVTRLNVMMLLSVYETGLFVWKCQTGFCFFRLVCSLPSTYLCVVMCAVSRRLLFLIFCAPPLPTILIYYMLFIIISVSRRYQVPAGVLFWVPLCTHALFIVYHTRTLHNTLLLTFGFYSNGL